MTKIEEALVNLIYVTAKTSFIRSYYGYEDVNDVSLDHMLWVKNHIMQVARAIDELLACDYEFDENARRKLEFIKIGFEKSAGYVPNPILFEKLDEEITKITKVINNE